MIDRSGLLEPRPPQHRISTIPEDRLGLAIYEPYSAHPGGEPQFYVTVDADLVRAVVPGDTKLVVGPRNTIKISTRRRPRIYALDYNRLVRQRAVNQALNRPEDDVFEHEKLTVFFDIHKITHPSSQFAGWDMCGLRKIHLE